MCIYPKVYDPYRWLENGESEETKQFVTDQMALTEQYFSMSQIMDKIDAKWERLVYIIKVFSKQAMILP